MFVKRRIFLLCICFCVGTCFGIKISSTQVSDSSFSLKFVLDKSEAICKSSIKFSVDSPGLEVGNWETVAEASEEYIVPIKLREKVYRGSFTIKLFMNKPIKLSDLSCLFSCLMFKNDESIVPFFTKINLISSDYHENVPYEYVPLTKKEEFYKSSVFPKRVKELIVYRGDMHDSSKILLLGLILFFLVWVLVIHVISFTDMAGFLLIGGWLCFGRIFFNYPVLLSVVAIILLCTSFVLLSRDVEDTPLQKTVRTTIGILSAIAVLPVVAEVFLTLYFGQ